MLDKHKALESVVWRTSIWSNWPWKKCLKQQDLSAIQWLTRSSHKYMITRSLGPLRNASTCTLRRDPENQKRVKTVKLKWASDEKVETQADSYQIHCLIKSILEWLEYCWSILRDNKWDRTCSHFQWSQLWHAQLNSGLQQRTALLVCLPSDCIQLLPATNLGQLSTG